jgi:Protein of unknown function (DUF2752)
VERNRQLGLLWGAAALFAAALRPLVPAMALEAPACLFRSLTGLPCPTCGATHAVVALAHLDPISAFGANPLVAAACLIFLAGGLLAGASALAGRPLREPRYDRPAARVVALAAIAANWAWVILRHP